jgi:hypothetical protein
MMQKLGLFYSLVSLRKHNIFGGERLSIIGIYFVTTTKMTEVRACALPVKDDAPGNEASRRGTARTFRQTRCVRRPGARLRPKGDSQSIQSEAESMASQRGQVGAGSQL